MSVLHSVVVAGTPRMQVSSTWTKITDDLRVTGLLVNHTQYALNCPNSYHVSEYGASEVRMFVLVPSMLLIDPSTVQVVYAPASVDTVSLIQQSIDPSMVLGARSSSGNNEGYIYLH